MKTDATVIIPTDLATARTSIVANVDAFGDHLAAASEHLHTLVQLAQIVGDIAVSPEQEIEKRSLIASALSCSDPLDYHPDTTTESYRASVGHISLLRGLVEALCENEIMEKNCFFVIAFESPAGGYGVKRFNGPLVDVIMSSSEFMLALTCEGGRIICMESTIDGTRTVTTGEEWQEASSMKKAGGLS